VVHSSSVTVDEMRGKLLTVDEARERLATTEPLTELPFDSSSDVKFRLHDGWNHGAKSRTDTEVVDASVSVNGTEVRLTQGALYKAMEQIHLSKGIGTDTPPEYIEPLINYWFRNGFGEEKQHKILAVDGVGSAIVRASVKPYSNIELMDRILQGISAKYGDGEVLVDYKFLHNLDETRMRLIVPEYRRDIVNTGTDNDTWSVGIDFRNSLTGKKQTSVSGYLFRWWCTNGAIDTLNDAGTWSRRGSAGQSDEVYEWARQAVDEVLGGLESSLDHVQAMTDMTLEGHTIDVLEDYYDKYRIKPELRDAVTSHMVDESNLTMYSLMQAFTQVANDADLSPDKAAEMMRIGGHIAATSNDRCDSCQRGFRH
jgi:hypothetical protein